MARIADDISYFNNFNNSHFYKHLLLEFGQICDVHMKKETFVDFNRFTEKNTTMKLIETGLNITCFLDEKFA